MANRVQNPYSVFTDANGDPLDNGYVYIGEQGLNPLSNPLQAYWDNDLTIPAANIRTMGGYPVYQGSPGILYTDVPYSILIKDQNDNIVFSSLAPPIDSFNSISVTGTVTLVSGIFSRILSAVSDLFSGAGIKYLWCSTVGGYFAMGTNGRPTDPAEANMVLNADQSNTMPGDLEVNSVEITKGLSISDPGLTVEVASITRVNATVVEGETPNDPAPIREAGGELLLTKVVEIGSWDMDADISTSVALGLTTAQSYSIIKSEVFIQDDTINGELRPLNISNASGVSAGYHIVDRFNGEVDLYRVAGGVFDSTSFDATTNRGWIIVTYLA